MPSLDHARLSSLASAVNDLANTAAEIAAQFEVGVEAEASVALYEAERSLHMAGRALQRARRAVGDA